MISLRELLESPKAIFLAGPAGSGKSTIIRNLFDEDKFTILNVDDHYEKMLKASGMGMNQKDFDHDQLSKAAKLMHQSSLELEKDTAVSTEARKDIILDSTGGSYKKTKQKKDDLEALGYKTFMLMLFVSPLTSLDRNAKRERQLKPSIVVRTWRDTISNIEKYRTLFGDNFVLINNDPKGSLDFSPESLEPYFGIDNEIDSKKEKINDDVKSLISTKFKFSGSNETKQKIKNFLRK